MRVKKYVAKSVFEAMQQIKSELGENAVILHTRKVKPSGLFGLLRSEQVEVTAATENKIESSAATEYMSDKKTAVNQNEYLNKSQISEVKEMMHHMMDEIKSITGTNGLPKNVQKMYNELLSNEVEDKVAKKLTEEVLNSYNFNEIKDNNFLEKKLEEQIKLILDNVKPIVLSENKKVLAFIGPTGVGKTTTIAKLAAHFSIIEKKKVGLITADTYRIAAVEQLKTFADIIGIPVEVVFSPHEMKSSLALFDDMDLILIDTAGRSHRNELHMAELKNFLPDAANIETEKILVLSVTVKTKDLENIIKTYCIDLDIDKLIFTKLDETNSYGAILNTMYNTKIPLSYITTGQNVPDDIELAAPDKLANLILKGKSI